MSVISLIASENFIAVNKTLIRTFGIDEAIMLGELASEFEYWKKQGELDENGFFFSTIENIEDNTGIKEKKQRAILNSLKEQELIEIKLKGLPAKRYIKLNEEKLVAVLLNNNSKQGGTRTVKKAELEQPETPSNKNNINKITNKNKEKKERKANSFDAIISEYSKGNEEIKDLLGEWLKVRKAKRAAMTDRAIQMNIDKLDKLAAQSKMSVIEYLKEIICRGWAAFYVINNYGGNGNKNVGVNGIALSNEKSELDGLF